MGGMTTPRDPIYTGYRHPAEIISCAVWLFATWADVTRVAMAA
jgi:hypothetical protein